MDRTTQQNSALVEESAAAAQSLKDQAGRLVDAVAVFKLAASVERASGTVSRAAAMPPGAGAAAPGKLELKSASGKGYVERRGPNRAKNVARPAFGAKPAAAPTAPAAVAPPPVVVAAAPTARTGTDEWESF